MVTLINPYVSLVDLKAELKMKEDDTQYDDTLLTAINLASRWVDDYRGRDYFGHDFRAAPLLVDGFSDAIFDDVILLPHIIRGISELKEGGTVLPASAFMFRQPPNALDRRLWRLGGKWISGPPPSGTVEIKGKLGGDQWVSLDPEISVTPTHPNYDLILTNEDPVLNNALLYWELIDAGGNTASLRFFSDEAHTVEVANIGGGLPVSTPWNEEVISEVDDSGYTGLVSSGPISPPDTYIGTVQLKNDVLDSTLIPTDLPPTINLAAKLVAAALSGHNRKEVAGLDGTRVEIHDNRIPPTVFQMLGRRLPIIL